MGFVLGQSIFTPTDTARTEVVENDRPYAGWLYLGVSATVRTDDRLDTFEATLGVVGPASLAGQAQTAVHRMRAFDLPQGWDNQLHNELVPQLLFDRKVKLAPAAPGPGVRGELIGNWGFAAGTAYVFANAGITARLGWNVDTAHDFGPPRIEPSLAGYDPFPEALGGYVFLGGGLTGVARNMFLDGNTFANSHRVEKLPVVLDLIGGAVLFVPVGRFTGTNLPSLRVAYTQTRRSREFRGQTAPDRFAGLSLSVQF